MLAYAAVAAYKAYNVYDTVNTTIDNFNTLTDQSTSAGEKALVVGGVVVSVVGVPKVIQKKSGKLFSKFRNKNKNSTGNNSKTGDNKQQPDGKGNDKNTDKERESKGEVPKDISEPGEVKDNLEIVRRFDSKKNIKDAKKNGIEFDSRGSGISTTTTTTTIEPINPDKIKELTGARSADEFIDINVAGKKKLITNTKGGKQDIKIQESISKNDIVDSGKVAKNKLSILDNE